MGWIGAICLGIAVAGCLAALSETRPRSSGPPFLPEGTGTAVFCVAVLVGAYFLGGHHP